MDKRNKKSEKIGDTILSNIIGKRPRKPATYEIRRLNKSNKADQDFCDDYDRRLAEWQKKADEVRSSNKKVYPDFKEKEAPEIKVSSEMIIEDFKKAYKHLYKRDFLVHNEYSDSNEPELFLKTLVYYFNKDQRFFKSPLLRADLSKPSFDKGTLSIGNYGCGKTTTYRTLVFVFKNYVDFILKNRPKNQEDLLSKFRISQCIATDVVLEYKQALKRGRLLDDIFTPLKTVHDLYIDDLLKEEILYKSSENEVNIFKDILTLRDERRRKSHISLNYNEIEKASELILENTEDSLYQIHRKYNGTVHDRIFGSYNILELKAKSLRR